MVCRVVLILGFSWGGVDIPYLLPRRTSLRRFKFNLYASNVVKTTSKVNQALLAFAQVALAI